MTAIAAVHVGSVVHRLRRRASRHDRFNIRRRHHSPRFQLEPTESTVDPDRGIATGVVLSALIAGSYGEGVAHAVTFSLEGDRLVHLKSARAGDIREGDAIAVAGSSCRRVFKACAYEKLFTGAAGNAGNWQALTTWLFFLAFSIGWIEGRTVVLRALVGLWAVLPGARIGLAEFDLRHELALFSSRTRGPTGACRSDV